MRVLSCNNKEKVPRNKVSLKRGVLGTWGRAEDSNRKWEKTVQYKEKLHLEWSMGQKRQGNEYLFIE